MQWESPVLLMGWCNSWHTSTYTLWKSIILEYRWKLLSMCCVRFSTPRRACSKNPPETELMYQLYSYICKGISWPLCSSSLFLQHGFFESLGCTTCKRVSWRCCFLVSKNWTACQVLPAYLPCAGTCDPAASIASTLAIMQAARPGSWSGRKRYTPPSHLPPKKKFSGVGAYAREIMMSFHNCHPYSWTWRLEAQFFCSELIGSTIIHSFIWTTPNFCLL